MNETRYPTKWGLFALIPLSYLSYRFFFPHGLQFFPVDAHVYGTALTDWLAGIDPYLIVPHRAMLFNYPPVFLYAGGALARILTPHLGWIVYLMFHFAAVGILPLILHRHFLHEKDCALVGLYWLFFAAPGFLGLLALETGNIAVLCYTAMLLAAIPGLTRKRWLIFYLSVLLCASVKITYLPMLLLPLLCGRRQWLWAAACVVACVLGLAAQRWFQPALYSSWVHNLAVQNKSFGDVGQGEFGIVFHVLHKIHRDSFLIPMAAYALVSLTVLGLLGWLWRRGCANTFSAWPALVLTGILPITPRVTYYDLCICSPLAFVMGTAALRMRHWMIYGLYICLLIPSMVFIRLGQFRALDGGFEAVTIMIFFFVTCATLVKGTVGRRGEATSSEEASVGIGRPESVQP
jgi:hypothetical protein